MGKNKTTEKNERKTKRKMLKRARKEGNDLYLERTYEK